MGMYEDFAACTLFYHHGLRLASRLTGLSSIKHRSALFCQEIIKKQVQEPEVRRKKIERRTSNVKHRMLNEKKNNNKKLFPLHTGERDRVQGLFLWNLIFWNVLF